MCPISCCVPLSEKAYSRKYYAKILLLKVETISNPSVRTCVTRGIQRGSTHGGPANAFPVGRNRHLCSGSVLSVPRIRFTRTSTSHARLAGAVKYMELNSELSRTCRFPNPLYNSVSSVP